MEIKRDLPIIIDKPVTKKQESNQFSEPKNEKNKETGNAETVNTTVFKVVDKTAPYDPEMHLNFDKPLINNKKNGLDLSTPLKDQYNELPGLNDLKKPPVKNPLKKDNSGVYLTPEKVGAKYEDSSVEVSIKEGKKGIKVQHHDTSVSVMLNGRASISKDGYSVDVSKDSIKLGYKTNF